MTQGPKYNHLERLASTFRQVWVKPTVSERTSGSQALEYGGMTLSSERTVIQAGRSLGIAQFDLDGGNQIWRFQMKNGSDATPVVHDGSVFVGANDGIFYALSEETGELLWKADCKAPVTGEAVVSQGRVFVMSSEQRIWAFDEKTGKVLWSKKQQMPSGTLVESMTIKRVSKPLVWKDRLFVGFGDGSFSALQTRDGAELWNRKLSFKRKFRDVDASPVLHNEFLYVPSYDGNLFKLSPVNGKEADRFEAGGVRSVYQEKDRVYLASSDGHVYALKDGDLEKIWDFKVQQGVPTNLLPTSSGLVVTTSSRFVYLVSRRDGVPVDRWDLGSASGVFSKGLALSKEEAGSEGFLIFSRYGNLYRMGLVSASIRKQINTRNSFYLR